MTICWNGGKIIADGRFSGISGEPVADGYRFKLSIAFNTVGWTHDATPPIVRLSLAFVSAKIENEELHLAHAFPELTIPFKVYAYGAESWMYYTLTLSGSAMEKIELLRTGRGVTLRLRLQGEIWKEQDVTPLQETVDCRISQSDWIDALKQCGYGHALLFEVPLPASEDASALASARYLQQANEHLIRGHYDEAVAVCRKALEAIQASGNDLVGAMKAFKNGKDKELSLSHRELVIRQALMNYTHPAHHHDAKENIIRYDRSSAAMVMGLTASVLSRVQASTPQTSPLSQLPP
ncbi:hypothetical protein [Aquabacterium sp.]|uniref:hypothetical protein n=1 Tax=Aquabacterium sp. TaxID=1872578 RepID=UPI003D6CBBD1